MAQKVFIKSGRVINDTGMMVKVTVVQRIGDEVETFCMGEIAAHSNKVIGSERTAKKFVTFAIESVEVVEEPSRHRKPNKPKRGGKEAIVERVNGNNGVATGDEAGD